MIHPKFARRVMKRRLQSAAHLVTDSGRNTLKELMRELDDMTDEEVIRVYLDAENRANKAWKKVGEQ
jgi:bisphosphoglycerate-dependent phosphoglycerate mutase